MDKCARPGGGANPGGYRNPTRLPQRCLRSRQESSNGWLFQGKKQALDLRGQLHILEKIITLLLNGFGKRFPLFDIPLDDINNKGEAQHRGEIVEDPKSQIDIPRRVIIVEQDTNDDKAVADYPAKENRARR